MAMGGETWQVRTGRCECWANWFQAVGAPSMPPSLHAGVRQQLDQLATLPIQALVLGPILEGRGANLTQIIPAHGSLAQLQALVTDGHKRGTGQNCQVGPDPPAALLPLSPDPRCFEGPVNCCGEPSALKEGLGWSIARRDCCDPCLVAWQARVLKKWIVRRESISGQIRLRPEAG